MRWCSFCGRREEDLPGGLWSHQRNPDPRAPAICVYCQRVAARFFGEIAPAQVVTLAERLGDRGGDEVA